MRDWVAELEEPLVSEVWDGSRGEYAHLITMRPSGSRFYVRQTSGGAYVGDFEIVGDNGFYLDGYSSPEQAIAYLCNDREHWNW